MNIAIRPETSLDAAAIETVVIEAFREAEHSSHTEQFIVRALRESAQPFISLVADVDGEIIGHVAASKVTITDGAVGWFGLGPLSVLPEYQRRGAGSLLMREVCAVLRAQGAAGCVLLGDPAYYRRFGFAPEPGLVLPDVPPEYSRLYRSMALLRAVSSPTMTLSLRSIERAYSRVAPRQGS